MKTLRTVDIVRWENGEKIVIGTAKLEYDSLTNEYTVTEANVTKPEYLDMSLGPFSIGE